jgi:hypothetical protein
MEDEPDTSPPAPAQPSPEDDAEAEDTTPQDAPAEPAEDPDDPDEGGSDVEEPSAQGDPPSGASHDLPRTTTTGDDAEDLRAAGDGAVSAAPGDELDDSAQRHE